MQRTFQCLLILVAVCLAVGPVVAADKPPIKIASDIPLTGPYAADGAVMKQCLDMAVDEYNANGGVLGRKVEIVYGDVGALEPEKVKAVGERLIAEKPDAVITGYDDVGLLTFGETNIPYFHSNGMSYIHDMFAKDPKKYSNVFDYGVTELEYALSAYDDFIRTAPGNMGWTPPNKKIAILALDFPYCTPAAKRLTEMVEKDGYKVVLNETLQFGQPEYGPILSKIEMQEPAFIAIFHAMPDDTANIMKQFVDYFGDDGLNALVWAQYAPSMPDFISLAGKAADGLAFSAGLMGQTPEGKDYGVRFKKRYGMEVPGPYAQYPRIAFDIWAAAVERAGCSDCYDKVNNEIRKISYKSMEGWVIEFAENNAAKYGKDFFIFDVIQYQNGKQVIITPAARATGKLIKPPWMK
jgi:branched-chain amino acid transport system substrate-binding protein